jgi:hypothetical protein
MPRKAWKNPQTVEFLSMLGLDYNLGPPGEDHQGQGKLLKAAAAAFKLPCRFSVVFLHPFLEGLLKRAVVRPSSAPLTTGAVAYAAAPAFVAPRNPEEIDLGEEEAPDAVDNPEEIELEEEEDEEEQAPARHNDSMFEAVEIHGSAVVDRREV